MERRQSSILLDSSSLRKKPVITKGTKVIFLRPPLVSASPAVGRGQWVEGKVTGLPSPTSFSVQASSDGSIQTVPAIDVARFPTNRPFDEIHDLCDLSEVHEPGLLFALQQRFNLDLPYTTLGSRMILAVNPYKWVKYDLEGGVPHPTLIAHRVLKHIYPSSNDAGDSFSGSLSEDRRPFSAAIVCTGQSGAGKTEATKMILKELSAKTAKKPAALERLEVSHPILELFGNARTAMNDNSSRYARYLLLTFSPEAPNVVDAALYPMLLETSRLTQRRPEDGNFHVLHALFDGITAKEREELELWDIGLFPAVASTSGNSAALPYTLADLRASLAKLGFDKNAEASILRLLAGILHLLRVQFSANDPHSPPHIADKQPLLKAGHLLGFQKPGDDTNVLDDLLTRVTIQIGGRKEVKLLNKATAVSYRDSLARALYEGLFEYLVSVINNGQAGVSGVSAAATHTSLAQAIQHLNKLKQDNAKAGREKDTVRTVGILDIFGFETVSEGDNDFEQLLINYTNEELQRLYNEKETAAFADEAEVEGVTLPDMISPAAVDGASGGIKSPTSHSESIPEKDGISATEVSAASGRACIECLSKKPNGILHLVSDESTAGLQGTTQGASAAVTNLVDKITKAWTAIHPKTLKRNIKDPKTFIVEHFCETVTYSAANLSQKNRISTNATSAMLPSLQQDEFIKKVLERHVAATKNSTIRCGGTSSQITLFLAQLNPLLDHLRQSSLYWVRCIKPNAVKSPALFAMPLVRDQLRTSGVLRTVVDMSEGFSVRLPLQQFVSLVKPLMYKRKPTSSPSTASSIAKSPDFDEASGKLLTVKEQAAKAVDIVPSCAGGRVLLGITLAFMQRTTLQEIEDLVSTRQMTLSYILQRVGRGYLIRLHAAAALRQKKHFEYISECKARMAAEKPIREELEKQRLSMHQQDATLRSHVLHGGIKRATKVVPSAMERLARTIATIDKELDKALHEMKAFDQARHDKELVSNEQEKYIEFYQRQAAAEKQKELDLKRKSEKAREDLIHQKKVTHSRKFAQQQEYEEKKKHAIQMMFKAKGHQIAQQLEEEKRQIEQKKAERLRQEQLAVRAHLRRAEERLLVRHTLLEEQRFRQAIEAEVIAAAVTSQHSTSVSTARNRSNSPLRLRGRSVSQASEHSLSRREGEMLSPNTTDPDEVQWEVRKSLWKMWEKENSVPRGRSSSNPRQAFY